MFSKLINKFTKAGGVEHIHSLNVDSDDVVNSSLAKEDSVNVGEKFFGFELSPEMRAKHIVRLGDWINGKLSEIDLHVDNFPLIFSDFEKMLSESPDVGPGTSGAGSLLWLFVIARALDAKQVVESGVFKGTSLHCWLHALPTAAVVAYDVSFDNLVVTNDRLKLIENDWKRTPPVMTGEDNLCYFDDHINNAQRINEAHEFGFKHLIFDDAPDIGGLRFYRYPGIPTAPMVWNSSLAIGETVRWNWVRGSGVFSYTMKASDVGDAKKWLDVAWEIPSHEHLTGQPCNLQCYVRLR